MWGKGQEAPAFRLRRGQSPRVGMEYRLEHLMVALTGLDDQAATV